MAEEKTVNKEKEVKTKEKKTEKKPEIKPGMTVKVHEKIKEYVSLRLQYCVEKRVIRITRTQIVCSPKNTHFHMNGFITLPFR